MIVAFVGPKGSGKSAAAQVLRQRGFQYKPFAGPMKDMLRGLGVPEECLTGDQKEDPLTLLSGQSARHGMKTLGTRWGREEMHPDFWVNLLVEQIAQVIDGVTETHYHRSGGSVQSIPDRKLNLINFVIDDMRFPNEYEAIKNLGGIVIRIERDGYEHDAEHPSEAHVLPSDHTLKNDGTLEDLLRKVQAVTS